MTKVTIIIPVFKSKDYIEKCITSLLNQTCDDFCVLFVDDRGNDGTVDIINTYIEKYGDKFFLISNPENYGAGKSRDEALKKVTTKYVMYVDGDDYVKEDYVETFLTTIEKEDADIVAGGYHMVYEDGRDEEVKMYTKEEDPCFMWIHFTPCAKIYKTEFLVNNNISFHGRRHYEDIRFTFSYMIKNPKIVQLPYSGYYYYYNLSSSTHSKHIDHSDAFFDSAEDLREFLEEKGIFDDEKNKEILQYSLASVLTVNMLYCCRGVNSDKFEKMYSIYDELMYMTGIDLKKNRFISRSIPISESKNYRYATWLLLKARRRHLDKMIMKQVSKMEFKQG